MTKYLFIDRKHIEMMHGLRQVFHQPDKDPGALLMPPEPWEESGLRIHTAPTWDPERSKWQMWYFTSKDLLPLYAESVDGLNWEKPALRRVEWEGSEQNNIVWPPADDGKLEAGIYQRGQDALFVRDDQEPDPDRRFKGLGWFKEKGVGSYLIPFVSKDGFDWTHLPGDKVPSEDTKRLCHDPARGRYILMVKGLSGCGVKRQAVAELGRIVYLSLSNDFQNWSKPELVFHADEVDQELGRQRVQEAIDRTDRVAPLTVIPEQFFTDVYFMPVFVYEDLYLALPTFFNQSGAYFGPVKGSNQDGILYPCLAASRDLHVWDRPDRTPFIPLSSTDQADLYDYAKIYANPPVRNGKELWFYYCGGRHTHVSRDVLESLGKLNEGQPDHGIFLARLRVDGFASLDAGDAPGILLTKPIKVSGSRLMLNADAAHGEIKVEIRDAETGRALAGYAMGDYDGDRILWSEDGKRGRLRLGPGARFEDDPKEDETVPISGDHVQVQTEWKGGGDLSALHDREVRIFFHLRKARLFSFWFEPGR